MLIRRYKKVNLKEILLRTFFYYKIIKCLVVASINYFFNFYAKHNKL